MSEQHHQGAWGRREDAVWWSGTIPTTDQQNVHHQHILNQHQHQLAVQQQNLNQQNVHHQVQVVQQPQTQANSTSSTVTTQQLFSYKMAGSFPATTMVATSNAPSGAYDYRLGMSTMVARPADPNVQTQQTITTTPGTQQWWYATTNQQQQQQQQDSNSIQQQQAQQIQTQSQPQQTHQQHIVHSAPQTVSQFKFCKQSRMFL